MANAEFRSRWVFCTDLASPTSGIMMGGMCASWVCSVGPVEQSGLWVNPFHCQENRLTACNQTGVAFFFSDLCYPLLRVLGPVELPGSGRMLVVNTQCGRPRRILRWQEYREPAFVRLSTSNASVRVIIQTPWTCAGDACHTVFK